MVGNYLKVASRNIARHKGYSIINIVGLAVGMTCSMLMLLWAYDEVGYDRFHEKLDSLYRVVIEDGRFDQIKQVAIGPAPLAPALKNEIPEIIRATRFCIATTLVSHEDKKFNEPVAMADPDIFDMFSFSLTEGNPLTALQMPHSVVLTRKMAEKYFGDIDAIGQTVRINNGADFMVTGILEDIPHNSSLSFEILVPFEYRRELEDLDYWDAWRYYSYVMLSDNSSCSLVDEKISGFFRQSIPEFDVRTYLQPFKKIHLYSNLDYDIPGRGDIKYVWIILTLALFIIIIACINFTNLATARAGIRAREIGLRKVIGAGRSNLIIQFFGEALFLSFAALALTVILIEILLPYFNDLSGKQLTLNYFANIEFIFGLFGIALLTGLLSGSYPAVYLSSFKPVNALKRESKLDMGKSSLRRILVVIQFTLSIILIVGAMVAFNQVDYMQKKDMGFNKEHVIYMRLKPEYVDKYQTLKMEFLSNSSIANVTAAFQLPSGIGSSPSSMDWEGRAPDHNLDINAGFVDYDYFETLGMKMAEGRSFSREYATDSTSAYILNEEAVRQMGIESPVGKWFSFWGNPGTIIGVVKDFHSTPLHNYINPVVLKIDSYWLNYIFVRIKTDDITAALEMAENSWKEVLPEYPFEYWFLDDTINSCYRAEERIGKIFGLATILAIIISCVGLYGLASYMAERRTKEIGIRKVLGASIPNVLGLLIREFIMVVGIAIIIAWPAAYYVMNKWLQNFAYRIEMSMIVFVVSAALALSIALSTVSYQVVRAARSNPVKTLRYE